MDAEIEKFECSCKSKNKIQIHYTVSISFKLPSMRLLFLICLFHGSSCFHVMPNLARTSSNPRLHMSLAKISLHFDFDRIPYAAGIQHIHSPEHVSETHRLGAPFFKIESVNKPNLTSDIKTSISFVCSTIFTKNMSVKMFSYQPNESNMLFFKDKKALYNVKFTVIPTKVGCAIGVHGCF